MSARLSPMVRCFALMIALFLASCAPGPVSDAPTSGPPTDQTTSQPGNTRTVIASPRAVATQTPIPPTIGSPTATETPTIAAAPSGRQLILWNEAFPGVLSILDADAIQTPGSYPVIAQVFAEPVRPMGLAFAAAADKVAYLTYEDGLVLTIADLELTPITELHLEEIDWLVDLIERGDTIPFYWGPHDKSVLIIDPNGGDQNVLYLVNDNRIEYIADGCRHLSLAESKVVPALWCKAKPPVQGFVVLQSDGEVRREAALPRSGVISIMEAAFHADGQSILSIGASGKVELIRSQNNPIETAIEYVSGVRRLPRNLYWSRDGTLALVYGNSAQCPLFFNDMTNEHTTRPCWHVLDSQSGVIVWYPTDELAATMQSTWDRIDGTTYPAALSGDGSLLAMSLRESGIRYFLVISLRESEARIVGNFAATALVWKP
jgi:hypothetical protein